MPCQAVASCPVAALAVVVPYLEVASLLEVASAAVDLVVTS